MPSRKGVGKLEVRTLTDAREDIDCKKWSDPKKYSCKGQHTHTQAYGWGAHTHAALLAILLCFTGSFL